MGATASGVVWSQLQNPDFLPSPYANTSLNTTGNAADNFAFGDVTVITGIRWWGVWCNADSADDVFRVRFYNDNGGLPDTTEGSTFVERFVTPTQVFARDLPVDICTTDPEEELEFAADLATSFTAAADTTYWIEIVSKDTGNNQIFSWSNASSDESRAKPDGDGAGAQRNDPISDPGTWVTQPDRAFELIGEVDTTELRASGVNPG
ncbi:MAG: hypothetical protein IID37_12025 [Planctomycetes bacterium]|nr:hypothetical protein [Planctomycetota bacterium]